ncbi:8406_t:CDS:10 [Acaulospora morrowiae]|uniref:8406_t:CDS:1 n=1 Tax=Acaulospora morrowiae TaxID=94023 RepID=A0A9N8Z213_9GLOM|nr:8406_t:CDS:10 [Acaulospora morrowiae]
MSSKKSRSRMKSLLGKPIKNYNSLAQQGNVGGGASTSRRAISTNKNHLKAKNVETLSTNTSREYPQSTGGKTKKSVKFQMPGKNEEWQSAERSRIFNEKVHEERELLRMRTRQQPMIAAIDIRGKYNVKTFLFNALAHTFYFLIKGTTQESVMHWKGFLFKADPIQNIATVIIRPFPGRCEDHVRLDEIMNKHRLWMKHYITLPYAFELINPNTDENLYLIEPIQKPTSIRNINEEYIFMRDNEIASIHFVGVSWLNDEKTRCWLIFPNTSRLIERLKLTTRPIVPYIICEKTLSNSMTIAKEHERIFDHETIQNNPSLRDIETFIWINNYHEIMKICENPGIRYMNFAPDPDRCPEIKEMNNVLDYLGAVYNKDYNDDIGLIHSFYEKQVLFMPNLMELKRLPNCKFRGYGVNPQTRESSNFVEFFPQGGFLTVTTAVFVKEQEVISRVLAVMKHQNKIYNDSKWELVLNENILGYLAHVATSMETQCLNAKIAYLDLVMHAKANKVRYFTEQEIFKITMEIDEPPTMLLSLHRTMIRIHTMYWKERRHFILIYDSSEDKSNLVPLNGVEQMTLEEFENQFGDHSATESGPTAMQLE